jgi:hypothetical protein
MVNFLLVLTPHVVILIITTVTIACIVSHQIWGRTGFDGGMEA